MKDSVPGTALYWLSPAFPLPSSNPAPTKSLPVLLSPYHIVPAPSSLPPSPTSIHLCPEELLRTSMSSRHSFRAPSLETFIWHPTSRYPGMFPASYPEVTLSCLSACLQPFRLLIIEGCSQPAGAPHGSSVKTYGQSQFSSPASCRRDTLTVQPLLAQRKKWNFPYHGIFFSKFVNRGKAIILTF